MRARRKDANHTDVGDFLRGRGWSVLDLAQYGCSVDFVVAREKYCALLEVKDGSKPPSARKLTEAEQKLKDNWQGDFIVALDPEDAWTRLEAARYLAGRTLANSLDASTD